ncbi:3-hydroxyacyl-CoA dehydrogenase type-2 [Acrasis kona]|uniref:3-hydroxyacyl-CoA dehydrogenase type-2 n=1 Tax=Acrasis kona TaxID=1008807 RepID=A0AAW2YPQ5_9EUKA
MSLSAKLSHIGVVASGPALGVIAAVFVAAVVKSNSAPAPDLKRVSRNVANGYFRLDKGKSVKEAQSVICANLPAKEQEACKELCEKFHETYVQSNRDLSFKPSTEDEFHKLLAGTEEN